MSACQHITNSKRMDLVRAQRQREAAEIVST